MSDEKHEPVAESPPDARSSRYRLVEAGAVLFHEEGYHHVSLDRVLREAGVVRSNFYYHFRSKEDLALAVIDTWLEGLADRVMRPALERTDLDPLQRVRTILLGLVHDLESTGCRGGCPFGSLANAEAEHNERFRRKLVETFDGFATMLQGLFEEAIRAGLLPDSMSAARLAACTLSVVQGSYLLVKTYAGITPMRLATEGLLEALGADSPKNAM